MYKICICIKAKNQFQFVIIVLNKTPLSIPLWEIWVYNHMFRIWSSEGFIHWKFKTHVNSGVNLDPKVSTFERRKQTWEWRQHTGKPVIKWDDTPFILTIWLSRFRGPLCLLFLLVAFLNTCRQYIAFIFCHLQAKIVQHIPLKICFVSHCIPHSYCILGKIAIW